MKFRNCRKEISSALRISTISGQNCCYCSRRFPESSKELRLIWGRDRQMRRPSYSSSSSSHVGERSALGVSGVFFWGQHRCR